MGDLDYRITDISGEQYQFKEAALAEARLLRQHKEEFDIWHPADCIGEIGAASLPCMLGVALYAAHKGYAPGPRLLAHLGNDDGKRVALVLAAQGPPDGQRRLRQQPRDRLQGGRRASPSAPSPTSA